jgi:hypothetical protein
MLFHRAWVSSGRGMRISQMMGLHRMDADAVMTYGRPVGSNAFNTWVEAEEARRVFWAAYTIDHFNAAISGWPMAMDDEDVCAMP